VFALKALVLNLTVAILVLLVNSQIQQTTHFVRDALLVISVVKWDLRIVVRVLQDSPVVVVCQSVIHVLLASLQETTGVLLVLHVVLERIATENLYLVIFAQEAHSMTDKDKTAVGVKGVESAFLDQEKDLRVSRRVKNALQGLIVQMSLLQSR